MWGFKMQNRLKNSLLKVHYECLGLMCIIPKEFPPQQFRGTYHFKEPVVCFGVKSQVISGFIPAFSVFFALALNVLASFVAFLPQQAQ